MYNSVIDTRYKEDDCYKIILTVPRNDYATIYGNIDDANAHDFVTKYLHHIEDDGIAYNVKVYDTDDSHLIKIEANINYIGNRHTDIY